MLILATVIWGSAFVSQSAAMAYIGPAAFQAIRCALAVLFMLVLVAVFDKKKGQSFVQGWKNKKLWIGGLLCGIPLFFACNLQQFGLVDTDAGKSAFLTAMYIVLVPVIGIFLGKKPSITVPVSVVIGVVGLYFISCAGVTSVSISDLMLLGCALMFAVQITFVDIYAPQVDALRLNTLQALVCTVLSFILALCTENFSWGSLLPCALPLLHTGVLSMGLAYLLQILGQKYLAPAPAALIMSLESVFAALFGMLLLGERLSQFEWIGCSLLFAAVILSQVNIRKKGSA